MKSKYDWEVGEIGIVTKNTEGIFSEGSIIQLELDDGSFNPIWKLLKGSCEYNNAIGSEPGAYFYYDFIVKLSDLGYFKDWKRPTEEEQDYFEMVEGYRLPWSEHNPFIFPEEK